jgi:hypothetical protein
MHNSEFAGSPAVISDLLGQSGRRIAQALAAGETDPNRLAELGDKRLHCSSEEFDPPGRHGGTKVGLKPAPGHTSRSASGLHKADR